jgi:hypothetical protein
MLATTQGWQLVPGFNIGTAANTASSNKSIIRGLAYHNKVYKALRALVAANPESGFELYVEPWFRELHPRDGRSRCAMCQPDAVLVDKFTGGGLVVEVKLNWKDGRDEKLLNLYLAAAKSAFGLEETWPVLVTRNVRGYKGQALLGLKKLEEAFKWRPGQLTPVLLHL